jgi:hypothetical protein
MTEETSVGVEQDLVRESEEIAFDRNARLTYVTTIEPNAPLANVEIPMENGKTTHFSIFFACFLPRI